MRPQLEPAHQVGLRVGQHPLQAERQGVGATPLRGGRGPAGFELGERLVERAAPERAVREQHRRVLARRHDPLARPPLHGREPVLDRKLRGGGGKFNVAQSRWSLR
jgi:hypothetical protein